MRGEWTYQNGLLDDLECRRLQTWAWGRNATKGTVGMEGKNVDQEMRDSTVVFVDRGTSSKMDEIFAKIDRWMRLANDTWFGVDYCAESLRSFQFSQYSKGQFYRPHQDCPLVSGEFPTQRKLSFTIQLSNEDSYKGGDLVLHYVRNRPPQEEIRKKGTIIAFPSTLIHEVTKVEEGTRNSLVGWYPGPRWR